MNPDMPRLSTPVGRRDHTRGSLGASVTLVEYGDYQCPYCAAAYPVIERVSKRFGAQLCFAYRHFPLSHMHPRAEPAAEAAEVAGEQDMFWPIHDSLFRHQEALEDEDLLARAEALGLDVSRFAMALATGLFAPRVREDFMSGIRSGVNGTPTLFVNSVRYDGPRDADSLTAALQYAAQRASRTVTRS